MVYGDLFYNVPKAIFHLLKGDYRQQVKIAGMRDGTSDPGDHFGDD